MQLSREGQDEQVTREVTGPPSDVGGDLANHVRFSGATVYWCGMEIGVECVREGERRAALVLIYKVGFCLLGPDGPAHITHD